MYEKNESTLTHSSGQTVRLSDPQSTSRDSHIHCLATIFSCLYAESFK